MFPGNKFFKIDLIKIFGPLFCRLKNNDKKKLKNICIYKKYSYICISIFFKTVKNKKNDNNTKNRNTRIYRH